LESRRTSIGSADWKTEENANNDRPETAGEIAETREHKVIKDISALFMLR